MMDRASLASRQWKAERPDIDPFPMALLGRLNEASQLILRDHLEPLFAEFGLRGGEFDVLATLRRSGSPFALTPTTLYEATMMSSGGMTNRVDRLERAGLVERRKHPSDRRGTLVALSAQGLKLIDQVLPAHVENERTVLSTLKKSEQEDLNRLLAKLIKGLDRS